MGKIPRKFIWFGGVILIIGGFTIYHVKSSAGGVVTYQTAVAQKGSLVVSIMGTGQVSASNQVDIKPSVSGTVLYVNVQPGKQTKSGTLLAQIDSTNAQKSVRDAQLSFDKANLALQKMQESADPSTLLADQNAVTQAQVTIQTDQSNLNKAYQDGFNGISGTFSDLPTIINGLNTILYAQTLNPSVGQPNVSYYSDMTKQYDTRVLQYKDAAETTYALAHNGYNKNFQDYNSTTRLSDNATVESVINETYQTSKDMSSAVQAAQVLIQFYQDTLKTLGLTPKSQAAADLSILNTYTSNLNSDITTLAAITQTIQSDKNAIVGAQQSLQEKQISLAKLQSGPDPLDIQSQQLAVQQAKNSLADARASLADYSVRAPFDGVAATVGVKNGDSISSATVISSFITTDEITGISLNEIDITKIKVGQDATLTFDAIPNFSIAGKVAQVDTIGTVSQGVVNYTVKISFATQDSRIKPGMSVSASVITDVHQDTLTVPNTAVKTNGTQKYVQILTNGQPQNQDVTVGLSNDTMTEILSGLQEGDNVVTQTINPNATTTTSSSTRSTGTGIPGLGGGTGGTFRSGAGGAGAIRIGG